MNKISCTSERFKNVKEYSSYKSKIAFKSLYPIVLILIIIFFLIVLQTNKWAFFLKASITLHLMVSFIYGYRRFFIEPKLFNRELRFDSQKLYTISWGKEREVEFEKLITVRLYKNLLLLEWWDKKFPWLINVQVEGLKDQDRSPDVFKLIDQLKSKSLVKDMSKRNIY